MLINYYNFNLRKKILLKKIKESLPKLVNNALQEDLGIPISVHSDITAQLIPKNIIIDAFVIAREEGVFCGKHYFEEVFVQLDNAVKINWQIMDGDFFKKNQILCKLQGPAKILLVGERTALNFLQFLCGIASRVKLYVEKLLDTNIFLLDTRKTLPGLRYIQKYAVLCGNGFNHRLDLTEAFLIKDNHIITIGSISKTIDLALKLKKNLPIEIEVENIQEFKEALSSGANIIMLDNFTYRKINEAILINQGKVLLGVSGNITLENLKIFAINGINYISVGSITKDIKSIDLSMQFISGNFKNFKI